MENLSQTEITYTKMLTYITSLSSQYPIFKLSTIGRSVLGNEIPAVKVGEGEHKILYVATHHSLERITSSLLLKFMSELAVFFDEKTKEYNIDSGYIYRSRTLYFVPMLNPDGVELAVNGLQRDNVIYDRLIQLNPGADFSHWQANARGIDLNHNYNCDFDLYREYANSEGINMPCKSKYPGNAPESEPEISSLTAFINALQPIDYIYSFHTQGEEIYGSYRGKYPDNAKEVGKVLSRLSGYELKTPNEKSACYSGLLEWYISTYNLPAYTIECGRGENPLPPKDLTDIYFTLRKMLFTTLIL